MNNMDYILKKHHDLYHYFKNKIEEKKINHFKLFPSYHTNIITPSCFCILYENYNDKIRLNLLDNHIQSRKYYTPLNDSKIANEIYNNILCIPCNIDLSYNDIDKIINLL